ncbi:MAG: hypothetical protein HYS12_23170 [Planctomycetes bacterium]|nr:hypothetical protein [Planctomycetota bacterium]
MEEQQSCPEPVPEKAEEQTQRKEQKKKKGKVVAEPAEEIAPVPDQRARDILPGIPLSDARV